MIRLGLAVLASIVLSFPVRADVDIQTVTSPGGIDAWLVEETAIPFVALEIRFMGGASLDLAGKRGATYLMTGLLEEGSGDLDARGFATARDDLAASFGFDVGDDSLSISARFLTENRDEAMALLRDAIVNPTFDQDAIERVRQQVLSGIRSESTDPGVIAGHTFDEIFFGDHPYATAYEGTAESVTALTRDDLVQAHARALTREHVYVGAAGDISANELGEILDQLLGDLPAEGPELPPEADLNISGGVTVVPFDVPQSIAVFGHRGIARDDPDFFPAFILNHVFGGSGIGSRLNDEVREERGLTYSIGTFFPGYDLADIYAGRLASANDRMGEAMDVIRAEWERIAREGITAEELDAAKTYLTGAYPLRFDSNARIAGIMVGMQMTGLTPDYITTRNDQVNAVTLDDVRRVAAELYRPQDLRFVVVGQPAGVTPVN